MVYLDEYAKDGLRTLLVAEKEINNEFYEEWNKKYQRALCSIKDKENEINKIAELIENEFILIGSTAIEDQLQDNVVEVIKDIRNAGVKLWVLTGDKIETAINIGYSCQVLDNEMEIFLINEVSATKINKELSDSIIKANSIDGTREIAIVIGGEQLAKIT